MRYCGRSSAVERLLAKEKVVSSNLIARSCHPRGFNQCQPSCSFFAEIAQLVEHATENCGVGSSSLPLGTFFFL